MSDSVDVLRPATLGFNTGWTSVPSGTLDAVTSDVDNATYMLAGGGGSQASFTFDAFTLPSLAIIKGLIAKVAVSDAAVIQLAIIMSFGGVNNSSTTFEPTASLITYSTSTLLRTPDGDEWTEDLVNAAVMTVIAGTFSAAHVAELEIDVLYNQAPVLTGFSVSSVASSQPIFNLPYSDPEGDAKERHEISVFRTAQSDPFNAPTEEPVWTSGEMFTLAAAQQCGVRLRNQTTYHAYARAADVGSNGRYGPAAHVSWTTIFDHVGTPTLTVPYADVTTASVLNVIAQGRLNLLGRDTSDLEAGIGSWAAVTNCAAPTSSTDHAQRGTHSLKVVATANGNVTVRTGMVAIADGELYTVMASLLAGSTTRDAQISLLYFDVSNTQVGNSVVATGTEVAGAWMRLWVIALAPANATTIELRITWVGCVAGEAHYIDCPAALPATTNSIENGDFNESGTLWTLATAGAGIAAVTLGDSYVVGMGVDPTDERCVILTMADGNSSTLETPYYLGVAPGEIIRLSFWARVISRDYGASQLTIDVVDQAGSSVLGGGPTGLNTLPLNTWAQTFIDVVPGGGVTAIKFRISAGDSSSGSSRASVRIDGVQVQRIDAGTLDNVGFEAAALTGDTVSRFDQFGVNGGWTITTYPSYTLRDVASFHSGAHSLRLGSAAGNIAPQTWHNAVQDVFCCGYETINLDYWWRLSNVTSSHVKVNFMDAARVIISPRAVLTGLPAGAFDNGLSTFVPVSTSSSGDTGWVHRSFAGLPIPPGAVYAQVELHGGWSFDGVNPGYTWFDDFTLTLNGGTAPSPFTPGGWSVGGYAAAHSLLIERSVDGVVWDQVRVNDVIALATAISPPFRRGSADYEAPNGRTVLYRVTSLVTISDGSFVPSSSWVINVVTPQPRRLWVKDPRDHTRNWPFYTRPPGVQFDPQERQVVKQTIGSTDVVVIADTIQQKQLVIPLVCLTRDDLTAFELLRSGQRTLLVQNHLGMQWYARFGPSASVTVVDQTPITYVDVTGLPQLAPLT